MSADNRLGRPGLHDPWGLNAIVGDSNAIVVLMAERNSPPVVRLASRLGVAISPGSLRKLDRPRAVRRATIGNERVQGPVSGPARPV